jgi:hypothetical protein
MQQIAQAIINYLSLMSKHIEGMQVKNNYLLLLVQFVGLNTV